MNDQNIIIRPVERSELEQAALLMNSQYARKKNTEYFRWQYFVSYPPSALMGSFCGNKLIGIFGLQKKSLSNGIIAGQLIDLLIASDFRGRGIFEKMAKAALSCFKDLQILTVLPNENGMRACRSKLGLKPIAKIDALILRKNSYRPLKSRGATDSNEKLISYYKNSDYLSWRYKKHPDYKYKFLPENGKKTSVTKIFQDPVSDERVGDIVDFSGVGPNSLPIQAIASLFSNDLSAVNIWALPHTNLFTELIKIGFVAQSQPRYFCLKTLDSKLAYLYNIKEWEIFPGDAELY